MTPARRLRTPRLDAAGESAVTDAIRRAERGNRGEVRVYITARAPTSDTLECARRLFEPLGMHKTHDDTGVLLYVAVEDRKAAVYAGKGIYGARAPDFWRSVTDAVAREAREGRLAHGIVAALNLIGRTLREVVPGEDRHGNELPDTIARG